MPQQFNLSLINDRTGERQSICGEFPDNTWDRFIRFEKLAIRLCQTRLIKDSPELSFAFTATSSNVECRTMLPPEDDISAFLHLMRPFVLQNEPTYFFQVTSLLGQHLALPRFRDMLKDAKDRYNGERLGFSLEAGGLTVTSPKALEIWLNAFEYHQDPDKQAILLALYKVFPREGSRAIFLTSMLDRVQAIGWAASIIEGFRKRDGIQRKPPRL